ncbi:unnamed protein product [Allacma fusca]|uniref:HAT C-terminal dimerisation domain-containing protein n=1 Tax=Allacma fusca TaxID=39272 RepID=A0A8J2KF68_9HEXA|nr:unnamed protein product [Allacma fusca]
MEQSDEMDSEHRVFEDCDPPSKPNRFRISKSTNLSQSKIETFLIPRSSEEKGDGQSEREASRETEKNNFGPTERGTASAASLLNKQVTEKDNGCPSEEDTTSASSKQLDGLSGRGTEPAVPKTKAAHSAVWKFFERRKTIEQSICKFCQQIVHSVNATNVKRHLKICQPDKYVTVLASEKIFRSLGVQLTSLSFSKYYDVNHPKQLKFRKAIAAVVAGTSITASAVCTEEVQEWFNVVDPKLRVPCRRTINKDSKALVSDSKIKIMKMMRRIPFMTISSDIWTTRGQTSSYLGVTSTFFHPELERKITVVMGVQRFQTVVRAITDGASNMICSHQMDNKIFTREEQREPQGGDEFYSDESETDEINRMQSSVVGVTGESDHDIMENSMNPYFPETLWNYVYNVLSRLCGVKVSIEKVLRKHKKEIYLMSDDDWILLEETVKFLKMFSYSTNMSSKDKEAVSFEVIVTIMSMYNHLDSYESHAYLGDAASAIKRNLKEKCSHFFYDKPGLNQQFEEKEMKEAFRGEINDLNSGGNKFEEELDRYINCSEYDCLDEEDVFKFWCSKRVDFLLLAPLALKYLSIPSLSANVERVFSRADLLTLGVNNMLCDENLEGSLV